MNITLDYRNPTPSHCDVAVFVNGALTGVLTLRQDEVDVFQHIVVRGMDDRRDKFLGTGDPGPGPTDEARALLSNATRDVALSLASEMHSNNRDLVDRLLEVEALLRELQTARPLLLYGEQWIQRIDETLQKIARAK